MSSHKWEARFTQGTSDGFAVQSSFRSQTSRILLHSNCYQGNKPAAAQQHPIVVWASEPLGLQREITNMTSMSVHNVYDKDVGIIKTFLRESSTFHKQEDRDMIHDSSKQI